MNIKKEFTTVTLFSKLLAGTLFVLMPFVGFLAGMKYQKEITPAYEPDYTYLTALRAKNAQAVLTSSFIAGESVEISGLRLSLPKGWEVLSEDNNSAVITADSSNSVKLSIRMPSSEELSKPHPNVIFTKSNSGMVGKEKCEDLAECHVVVIGGKVFLLSWAAQKSESEDVKTKSLLSEEIKETLWKVAMSAQLNNK